MLQRVGGAIGASVLFVVAPVVVALGSPAPALGSPVPQKAPSPGPSASGSSNRNLGPSIPGSNVCTMSDPQLTEISGIVATADGYAVINDSNVERAREKIFFLNEQCAVTRSVGYPSSAFDPEDLAIAKDGTLWVADIGDNTTLTGGSGNRRSSIALWSLAPGQNTPVIHRLAYPDGKARDAEALIIDGEGRPVIITKDPVGEVYTLTQPLPANNANPAALTRAGSFRPQATGTTNPYGILGTSVVTGAALSPDGKRAVVRTMADAYEFDVTDGNVVDAITGGSVPRITPLPSEPQGEGIAYTRDGTEFVTTSDQPKASSILRYTPYAPVAAPSAAPTVQAQAPKTVDRSFLQSLTLQDITRIVIGIGVLGVLMIAVGVFAVIRSRRRRRALLVSGGVVGADGAVAAADSASPDDPAVATGSAVSAGTEAGSVSASGGVASASGGAAPSETAPSETASSQSAPSETVPLTGSQTSASSAVPATEAGSATETVPNAAAAAGAIAATRTHSDTSATTSATSATETEPATATAAPAGTGTADVPAIATSSAAEAGAVTDGSARKGGGSAPDGATSPGVPANGQASDSTGAAGSKPGSQEVKRPDAGQPATKPTAPPTTAPAPAQSRGSGSSGRTAKAAKAAKATKSSKRSQAGDSSGSGPA
ncbi:hypothetical protein ACQP1P_24190 [Dactylosporangium sp. CA-052675]|uniref:hypothetical protein n=1 Tax=Dactylosporangium sp. CA-052675 TaxID=3239927 RepID=UPI003D8A8401